MAKPIQTKHAASFGHWDGGSRLSIKRLDLAEKFEIPLLLYAIGQLKRKAQASASR